MNTMKTTTKTAKKLNMPARFAADKTLRPKILAFLKTHNNSQAKAEFGCSAHFAGSLRKEAGIKLVVPVAKGKKDLL